MKYPSLLDSKEGTSGMLLDSKETGMCCSSELKEVTMILGFFFISQVLKCLRILWCVRILKIHSPPLLSLFFVQMNSLFIEKGFWEAWGEKNNKIRLSWKVSVHLCHKSKMNGSDELLFSEGK